METFTRNEHENRGTKKYNRQLGEEKLKLASALKRGNHRKISQYLYSTLLESTTRKLTLSVREKTLNKKMNASPAANFTSDSGEEGEFILLDYPGAKLVLIVVHTSVLASLFACAAMMHRATEVAHPVFAVAFQEVAVLCCGELLAFLLLLPMMVEKMQYWFSVFMIISTACLQFHQLSWLAITCLRYVRASQLIFEYFNTRWRKVFCAPTHTTQESHAKDHLQFFQRILGKTFRNVLFN